MSTKTNQNKGEDYKPVCRSVDGRILGGVAAGLAKYFGFDVAPVRVVLVALAFIGGAGVPLYLAAWVLIPDAHSIAIADGVLGHAGSQTS